MQFIFPNFEQIFVPFGRICGRKSPAAISFHNKGHPYYITMHMKIFILPATLTPLGSRSSSEIGHFRRTSFMYDH